MPGMNGERLAVKLAAKRPDLPVLFVSGFAPDAVLLERLAKPATSFLAKPFTRIELGHAVRRAIDRA
jgi:FixJ family two-component response regulator